jgi:hypothetical protein
MSTAQDEGRIDEIAHLTRQVTELTADMDAVEAALTLHPGAIFEGNELLHKGVENGHFVWFFADGGCASLNNIIAKLRPLKSRRTLEPASTQQESLGFHPAGHPTGYDPKKPAGELT